MDTKAHRQTDTGVHLFQRQLRSLQGCLTVHGVKSYKEPILNLLCDGGAAGSTVTNTGQQAQGNGRKISWQQSGQQYCQCKLVRRASLPEQCRSLQTVRDICRRFVPWQMEKRRNH